MRWLNEAVKTAQAMYCFILDVYGSTHICFVQTIFNIHILCCLFFSFLCCVMCAVVCLNCFIFSHGVVSLFQIYVFNCPFGIFRPSHLDRWTRNIAFMFCRIVNMFNILICTYCIVFYNYFGNFIISFVWLYYSLYGLIHTQIDLYVMCCYIHIKK